jgi:hypothetical protein
MKRLPRLLTGTLLGLAVGCTAIPAIHMGPPSPEKDNLQAIESLFCGAPFGAMIGAMVEFMDHCWPLDPPPWGG